MTEKVSYKDAGVDIDRANSFIKKIQPIIKGTTRREVRGGIGNFGGLFNLDMAKFTDPILVSSTDGVGTKLKIAQMMDKHDTIGIDLVAMSVNDILVQGAEPLFFLDYIATGKIDVKRSVKIVEGIAKGCIEAGCALIGGETAEMPDLYKVGDYDLAGFCVGVVDAGKLIDGSEISVGDRIIGIASNGIHSNGFSLARKVLFGQEKLTVKDKIGGLAHSIGTELLRPTKIYVKPILNLIKNFNIKGITHITGGGFIENIPRILPDRCRAIIDKGSWDVPPIFTIIQEMGNIDKKEMLRVFNMGVGMMVVVSKNDLHDVMERLEGLGQRVYEIGIIDNRDKRQKHVSFR